MLTEPRDTDIDEILRLVEVIEEQAPPVRVEEPEEDTLPGVTVRMSPAEFASLVDFDAELCPWLVNERHGV